MATQDLMLVNDSPQPVPASAQFDSAEACASRVAPIEVIETSGASSTNGSSEPPIRSLNLAASETEVGPFVRFKLTVIRNLPYSVNRCSFCCR